MKVKGIRQMILLSTNAVVVVLLLLTGIITFFYTHHELDELFNAQLNQYTRLIDRLALTYKNIPSQKLPIVINIEKNNYIDVMEEDHGHGHNYENNMVFQVWSDQKELVMRSENAPDQILASREVGYHHIQQQGEHWIVFASYNSEYGYWIFAGQSHSVRDQLNWHLSLKQLIPLVFALLFIVLCVWLSVNWGMNPIRKLSKILESTKPAELQPIEIELPVELKPIQTSINQLLDDLASYLDKEKRFIANVSHELRTPLSVLLVHADNVRNAVNKEQIESASDAILISTKRLSHLVDQLMDLEKLEQIHTLHETPVNLLRLVNQSLALLDVNLLKSTVWEISIDTDIEVYGDESLLQVAIVNLLDNAGKYSSFQNTVTIKAELNNGSVIFTVGNHIQEDFSINVDRVGERFYRHPRNRKIHGAGLGLSIVKKIIFLHQAKVTFYISTESCFTVQISFPKQVHISY